MKNTQKNKKNKKNNTKTLKDAIYTIACILLITAVCIVALVSILKANVSFWKKPNELRIISQLSEQNQVTNETLDQNPKVKKNTDDALTQKVDALKLGIAEFFKEVYNVDITYKLNMLKELYIFSLPENGELGILYGYCDLEYNTLNLNSCILNDEVLFDTVFVHEVIHYLGLTHRTFEGEFFIEGITDALTSQCLEFLNKEFDLTYSAYYLQRELALQMLVVDKDLVVSAITQENFEIMDKINDVLKDVPRTVFPCDNVAESLELAINGFTYNMNSLEPSESISKITTFIAQEIVACYCKEFNPNKEQISEIRKHYIVENFESRDVVMKGDSVRLY